MESVSTFKLFRSHCFRRLAYRDAKLIIMRGNVHSDILSPNDISLDIWVGSPNSFLCYLWFVLTTAQKVIRALINHKMGRREL